MRVLPNMPYQTNHPAKTLAHAVAHHIFIISPKSKTAFAKAGAFGFEPEFS
jgi:hypothetical protein